MAGAPGDGPDLRFLQANERTLLAWLRTGIALMGFGFVIARFAVWMRYFAHGDGPPSRGISSWLGVVFVALGALTCALGGVQYLRIQRAIVAGKPVMSTGALGPALALVLAALGGALGVYLVASMG